MSRADARAPPPPPRPRPRPTPGAPGAGSAPVGQHADHLAPQVVQLQVLPQRRPEGEQIAAHRRRRSRTPGRGPARRRASKKRPSASGRATRSRVLVRDAVDRGVGLARRRPAPARARSSAAAPPARRPGTASLMASASRSETPSDFLRASRISSGRSCRARTSTLRMPSWSISAWACTGRPGADRQHRDHRPHPEHDPQHGQARAQLVRRHAAQRRAERLPEVHRSRPSPRPPPSGGARPPPAPLRPPAGADRLVGRRLGSRRAITSPGGQPLGHHHPAHRARAQGHRHRLEAAAASPPPVHEAAARPCGTPPAAAPPARSAARPARCVARSRCPGLSPAGVALDGQDGPEVLGRAPRGVWPWGRGRPSSPWPSRSRRGGRPAPPAPACPPPGRRRPPPAPPPRRPCGRWWPPRRCACREGAVPGLQHPLGPAPALDDEDAVVGRAHLQRLQRVGWPRPAAARPSARSTASSATRLLPSCFSTLPRASGSARRRAPSSASSISDSITSVRGKKRGSFLPSSRGLARSPPGSAAAARARSASALSHRQLLLLDAGSAAASRSSLPSASARVGVLAVEADDHVALLHRGAVLGHPGDQQRPPLGRARSAAWPSPAAGTPRR